MLNFIRSIREGLKDPKKKSITKLILYIIFFTFVFVLFSQASNRKVTPVSEPIKKTFSYSYNVEINNNSIISNLNGIYSEDRKSFNYNNNEYTIIDDEVYLNGIKVDSPINVKTYYYDNIKSLIEKSISTTTYKDDSTKTIYSIRQIDYDNDCVDNCDKIINITIYEDKYINNAIIDFNNNYIVNIKYEEIKNASN